MYIESRLACRTIVITLNYIVLPNVTTSTIFRKRKLPWKNRSPDRMSRVCWLKSGIDKDIIQQTTGLDREQLENL
jgi:hypothetical protein